MDSVVRCLKGLGDENRLRIVMLLMGRELCVCQLMSVLGISQPLVSRHLSVLRHAGLVQARREGKLIFYSVTDKAMQGGRFGLMKVVRGALAEDPVIQKDANRLPKAGDLHKLIGTCRPARPGARKGNRGTRQ